MLFPRFGEFLIRSAGIAEFLDALLDFFTFLAPLFDFLGRL